MGILILLPFSLMAATAGGKKCCSNDCTSIFCKSSCAREGDACGVASSKCQDKGEKEKVDCSKKTEDGKSCCVFSKTGSLCECVQRRCHHELHPGQVPNACVAKMASPQWPVLLSAFFLVFLAGLIWWLKRRSGLKEERREADECSSISPPSKLSSSPPIKAEACNSTQPTTLEEKEGRGKKQHLTDLEPSERILRHLSHFY